MGERIQNNADIRLLFLFYFSGFFFFSF